MDEQFFGETRWLDELAYADMVPELAAFCAAVQAATPYTLQFYGRTPGNTARADMRGMTAFSNMMRYIDRYASPPVRAYERCYVAIDGDPLIIGGMCVAEKHAGDMLYTVYSDNIENNKFAHGKGTRSASSKKLEVAVKNARKYLRKRPENETAKILSERCRAIINKARTERISMTDAVMDEIFGDISRRYDSNCMSVRRTTLFQELLRLAKVGAIQDQNISNAIMETQKMTTEIDKLDPAAPGWHIVFTQKNRAGQPRVVMAKMMVHGNPQSWSKTFDVEGTAYVMEPHEVPEIVQGRMAVLQMLEDGKYVDGVGVRLSDACFYVNLVGDTEEAPSAA